MPNKFKAKMIAFKAVNVCVTAIISSSDSIEFITFEMSLKHLSIEFIGHLSPWKSYEILNIHSSNGGMSHLLFLVRMRALCIYCL